MKKKVLRELYKQKRASLSEDERSLLSERIAQSTLSLPLWEQEVFHTFLSIEAMGEVATAPIIRLLRERNKHIVVSRTLMKSLKMEHFLYEPSLIQTSTRWGIPEPQGGIPVKSETIDVVFVPLLAYDIIGNRIGYGKGFYDAFLEECREDTYKVGLSFFPPEEAIEDVRPQDVKLDCVVTPEAIYKF